MALNFAGYVTNTTGAAVNNATVEAWVPGEGAAAYTTTSDANGYWHFDACTDNTYYILLTYGGVTRTIDGRSKVQVAQLDSTGPIEGTTGIFSSTLNVTGATTLAAVTATTGSFSGQVTSTLAIGTSPFAVTSTTVNTNLNADKVDGFDATATAAASKVVVSDGSGKIDTWVSDATTSTKGKASFDTGDFTVTSGAVTIKDSGIDHGAVTGLADDDHTQYIKHALSTAGSDFLVGSGLNTFVKKTLAETKTILGLGTAAYTAATDYAVTAKGVTNGDTHDHSGGDGGQIAHTTLSSIGTNTHAQIDTAVSASTSHIAASSAHGATGNILGATTAAATYAPIAKGVTNGDTHDHSGGDGSQINHTTLSNVGTNSHSTIDTFIASKAGASGLASLSAGSLVVQNPANATATATASKIPIADGSGKLDTWVTDATTSTKGKASFSSDDFAVTAGAVTIKADGVDIAQIGNQVVGLLGRQGGSATAWATAGTSNYTPTTVRIQAGVIVLQELGAVTVTFPVAFSNTPVITLANHSSATGYYITSVAASNFELLGAEGDTISWIAIGPE